jgi:hypothetical protein
VTTTPKRRWYQFSLRMLLVAVTLAAIGSGWWNHRSVCLEQCRIHAERNAACAKKLFGGPFSTDTKDDGWEIWGMVASCSGSNEDWRYTLKSAKTSNGYDRWVISVESGKLPAAEDQIKAEMDCEGEKADEYFHAIWRPWERLWIDESPPSDSL